MNKRSRQSHPEIQAGARFGRWVVLSPPKYQGASLAHDCRCDCGTTKTVRADRLRNGASKSCGCAARESLITHGFTCKKTRRESREYWIWNMVVQRCTNPKVKNWNDYGGRGITVCERWMKFENFYADMGRRPSSKHSIERINNDGRMILETAHGRFVPIKQRTRGTIGSLKQMASAFTWLNGRVGSAPTTQP